jgi:hypothetical protein
MLKKVVKLQKDVSHIVQEVQVKLKCTILIVVKRLTNVFVKRGEDGNVNKHV